jgi:hypothetical protein
VVVNDNDLAAVWQTPIAAQQTPALVAHRVDAGAIGPVEYRYSLGTTSLDVHVLRLPSEAISVIVPDNGLPTFLDDNASWFLNQETVTLAYFAAGPAHIIETPSIILGRRRHEEALRLRRRRSGGRRRWL